MTDPFAKPYEHLTQEELEATRRNFVAQLVAMKHEAGRLSMWRTAQALDQATNTAGFELADLLTGKQADLSKTKGEL